MNDCNEIKTDVTTDIAIFLVICVSLALMHLSTDCSHTCSNEFLHASYTWFILLDDRNRVVLQQQLYDNVNNSDYINAIYVEVTNLVILYKKCYCLICIIRVIESSRCKQLSANSSLGLMLFPLLFIQNLHCLLYHECLHFQMLVYI